MAPVRLGAASTVKKPVPDDAEPVVPAVEIVTETWYAAETDCDWRTILGHVPPASEQLAVTPPTVALHEAAASCAVVIKLSPVTVMVLPA